MQHSGRRALGRMARHFDALDAGDDSLVPIDEQPEETHDDRGPCCRSCGDRLPLGQAGRYCDDCVEPDAELGRVFGC